jgi:hypothetical protein
MLSACAHSLAPKPTIAPDPIVETRTVTRLVCPAEVTAASPAMVPDYAGAAIVAPPIYFDWLTEHLRREALLDRRIDDARGSCPK